MRFEMFEPAGPAAAQIADLGWVLIAVSAVIYLLVLAATGWALFRRRSSEDDAAPRARTLKAAVVAAVGASFVILAGLFAASVYFGRVLAVPEQHRTFVVDVVGHQWWWEFTYRDDQPSRRFSTANELRIPVGVPVILRAQSRDVIHSFWVPELHGKRDLIPGRPSDITLMADRPGIFKGRCAEFCGLQHAKMAFEVIAEPRARFDEWLTAQRASAVQPRSDAARRGHDVFMQSTCALCHTVRGTTAGGRVGPDLTHVGSRRLLAAGTIPNATAHLTAWILDPQSIKPGARMPAHNLAVADREALVTYLRSLR